MKRSQAAQRTSYSQDWKISNDVLRFDNVRLRPIVETVYSVRSRHTNVLSCLALNWRD